MIGVTSERAGRIEQKIGFFDCHDRLLGKNWQEKARSCDEKQRECARAFVMNTYNHCFVWRLCFEWCSCTVFGLFLYE
jgi:hypothetical protein